MTYNKYIESIYSGEIDLHKLSLYAGSVYLLNKEALIKAMREAMLDSYSELQTSFETNLSRFSGAKTFQESLLLTKAVFKEGKKIPFAEFKKIASQVNSTYNTNYLKTEANATFARAQSARAFRNAEAQKDILPYLEYVTVGDERVRHSHAELDGIVKKVDDPFWSTYMPMNDWGCRCITIQRQKAEETPLAEIRKRTKEVDAGFKKDALFANNPAKSSLIFKEKGQGKHPYFKVPSMFIKDKNQNFGFNS